MEARSFVYAIEKDGSERRADVLHHTIKTRGRVTLEPKPVLDGYEHIDWMQLRADEYPRDTAGTTTLEIRYADPNREDDLYIYVPSIRRVRRAPPIQRCATIAPSEFNFDDINSFDGKITDFNYRFLGRTKMLGNLAQAQFLSSGRAGTICHLKEKLGNRQAYGLEITPKDPNTAIRGRSCILIRKHFETVWTMVWDA